MRIERVPYADQVFWLTQATCVRWVSSAVLIGRSSLLRDRLTPLSAVARARKGFGKSQTRLQQTGRLIKITQTEICQTITVDFSQKNFWLLLTTYMPV
jgi:hypothetical protein